MATKTRQTCNLSCHVQQGPLHCMQADWEQRARAAEGALDSSDADNVQRQLELEQVVEELQSELEATRNEAQVLRHGLHPRMRLPGMGHRTKPVSEAVMQCSTCASDCPCSAASLLIIGRPCRMQLRLRSAGWLLTRASLKMHRLSWIS